MKNRINYIDAFRGIAILGVIFAHTASYVDYDGYLSYTLLKSGYGVQLFFIISAFTIFLSLDHSTKMEKRPIINFYTKRLLRIAPVYWLGIVVYTLLYGLESRGWHVGPELWHYPLHLLFLNSLHPETTSSVVPGGWSISCEVLFYMLCPLLFKYITSLKRAFVLCIVTIIFGVMFLLLCKFYITPTFSDEYGEKALYIYFYRSIISQIGIFSLGIMMFYLVRLNWKNNFITENSFCLLLFIVSSILLVIGFSGLARGASHYVVAFSFLLFGVLVSIRPTKILVNGLIIFIGRVSFSAYIVHFIAIRVSADLLGSHLNMLSLLVMTLMITIPLSYFSFKVVECNAIKLARVIVSNRESKIKTVATESKCV